MKRALLPVVVSAVLAAAAGAQEARPALPLQPQKPVEPQAAAELVEQRDQKLASAWLALAPWHTDLEAARAEAKRRGALIFTYFTRSYAPCGPCTRLENTLLSDDGAAKPAFVDWAADHVLLLHVTSYVFTDAHHDLCADRGGFGFPYLAFLDADGQWLASAHGQQTLEACERLAEQARERCELAEKAKVDAAARVELLLQRLRAEALSFDEARAEHAAVAADLTEAQAAEVAQLMVNRECAHELAALRRRHPDHEGLRRATAPVVAALFRAGKMPTNRLASHYLQALFGYARVTGDRELYADALAEAERRFGEDESMRAALGGYRQQLDAWKQ